MSSQDTRKKMMERRVLTPNERTGLQDEHKRNEGDLRGETEGVPREYKSFMNENVKANRDVILKRNQKINGVLQRGEPENISKGDRMGLEKDAKELEGRIISKMIPKSALSLKPGSIEFRKAVNALTKGEMSQEYAGMATRWKNIQRTLNPDDPDASNLERIRPN